MCLPWTTVSTALTSPMPRAWFYYVTGFSHAVRFLTVLQGHCYNDDRSTCPKVTLYSASGATVLTREEYLTGLAGLPYESRWPERESSSWEGGG